MKTQLITIAPDGSLRGLQFKGKGVDLQKVGRAKTKRVTDIEWEEDKQAWTIRFLLGDLAGVCLSMSLLQKLIGKDVEHLPLADVVSEGLPFWRSYDDAVKAEVHIIQTARKIGKGASIGQAD